MWSFATSQSVLSTHTVFGHYGFDAFPFASEPRPVHDTRYVLRVTTSFVQIYQRVSSELWLNILALPVYAAAASFVILLLQAVVNLFRTEKASDVVPAGNVDDTTAPKTLLGRFRSHVNSLGGWVIFAWRTARLLALAALVGLNTYTVTLVHGRDAEEHGSKDPRWPHIGLVVVYVCSQVSYFAIAAYTHRMTGLFHSTRFHDRSS